MKSLLPGVLTIAAALGALLAPASASAMVIGLESNSEFINSDRTPELQSTALDRAHGLGAQIIRANVNWSDVARNCAGQTSAQLADNLNACYNWSVLDNFVAQAKQRGIQVLFSVSQTPFWVNKNSDSWYVGATSGQYNNTVNQFTTFMTAIGTRYNASSSVGEVRYWTIWNEPNSNQFFKPMVTAAQKNAAPLRYAAMYAKAAVALRKTSSRAYIAPGPTGPSPLKGVSPGTFIKNFQVHATRLLPGASLTAKRSYINAWAHNPYPYALNPRSNPATGRLKAPNFPLQRTRDLIKQIDASKLTKGRMIWATEFGYETPPIEKLADVPIAIQGRWMADAFDILDSTNRVGIAIWYGMTDPTNVIDWQSGTFTPGGAMKPSALWARRPIAVNMTRVKRGGKVQVYAKSNPYTLSKVSPIVNTPTFLPTKIQYSTNGKTWKTFTGVKLRADGSIRANVRVTAKKIWFATYDGVRGPAVAVASY